MGEDKNAELEKRIKACRRGSTSLDLSRFGLTRVPDAVRSLTHLTFFDLSHNDLQVLPEWMCELAALEVLVLTWNEYVVFPECLGKLTNLKKLHLASLALSSVPEFIRGLPHLESLDLSFNKLITLPEWLRDLPSLVRLWLGKNPDLPLPMEVIGSGYAPPILDYYFRTSAGALPLNEFKLILIGRGGVGKTSLVHRLVHDEYKTFERTPGINITKWFLRIDGDEVRAHVWDFGGQEIMHGTHRFFMTERAVYLIVISGREGTEDHDAEYWLSLIRSFAGEDVPVVVLLHKHADYPLELNRELLRDKYGRQIQFLQTDSLTGHNIETLKDQLRRQANGLSGLRAPWPAEWRKVKQDLPASKQNWLTFDDFRAFCAERGVTEARDQEALAESLHALGLMLRTSATKRCESSACSIRSGSPRAFTGCSTRRNCARPAASSP